MTSADFVNCWIDFVNNIFVDIVCKSIVDCIPSEIPNFFEPDDEITLKNRRMAEIRYGKQSVENEIRVYKKNKYWREYFQNFDWENYDSNDICSDLYKEQKKIENLKELLLRKEKLIKILDFDKHTLSDRKLYILKNEMFSVDVLLNDALCGEYYKNELEDMKSERVNLNQMLINKIFDFSEIEFDKSKTNYQKNQTRRELVDLIKKKMNTFEYQLENLDSGCTEGSTFPKKDFNRLVNFFRIHIFSQKTNFITIRGNIYPCKPVSWFERQNTQVKLFDSELLLKNVDTTKKFIGLKKSFSYIFV